MATIIKLIQEALQENLETVVLMLIVVGSLSGINIILVQILDSKGLELKGETWEKAEESEWDENA